MKHKYVRHAELGFVLWPMTDALYHSHIGEAIAMSDLRGGKGGIMSAGFAYIDEGCVRCDGMSESLHIRSRSDDAAALAQQLGLSATSDATDLTRSVNRRADSREVR